MNNVINKKLGLAATYLSKSYNKKPIIRDVSLNIKRGEVVGLLGPNGAGKTSCFYMISGLIKPDTGSIHLEGLDITRLPMYQRAKLGIGYLPQESSIFRGMSVADNILSALELKEKHPEKRREMLEALLAEFSISHLEHAGAVGLSGGERRRVEIARAIATDPQYILLDEPLAGIDPIAIDDVKNLITHLKDRNIGILITDHNVKETLSMIDRAYIIFEGKVIFEGTPEAIVQHKQVKKIYLGERFQI